MADANDSGACRECRGTGRVTLLTGSRPCGACGGSGRAAGAAGPSPSADTCVYALGLAAPAAAKVTCEVQRDDRGRAVRVTRRGYDEQGRLVWQSNESFAPEAGAGDGSGPGAPASFVVARHSYHG